MNKYLLISTLALAILASCGRQGGKKVAVAEGIDDSTETIPRITVTVRDNTPPGPYCSGVVVVTVPHEFYEILVPGLDTVYFRNFDPQPHWYEYETGYEGERERDWSAQMYISELWYITDYYESLGAVVGGDGTIVTTSSVFDLQEINVSEVQEYFMGYMLSGEWWRDKTKFANGEMGYDKAKLADLKVQDIQASKKGGGDIVVRFFRRNIENLIELNPPTDTGKYYFQENTPYKAELIGRDEDIALIQLSSRTVPPGTVIFDISDAKKRPSPDYMKCIRMFQPALDNPREYLVIYGEPLHIYEIDDTTNIFNYGTHGGQIGSPLIDAPRGTLVGLDIGSGTKFTLNRMIALNRHLREELNYAISAGEIRERIQRWRR